MDGYVTKPIELKLLLATIASTLSRTCLTGPTQSFGSNPVQVDRSDAADLVARA
jgi:DNA-binding response OmpR family regulator